MEIFSNPVGTVFVLQVSQSKVIASDNVFVLIIANPFQDNTVLVGSSLVHCNIQCPFVVVRFISRHTVDNHLRNIRERFGLHKNTEIILLYIAQLNHKPFSLANIKQYGLEVILVLVNICTYTDLKSL